MDSSIKYHNSQISSVETKQTMTEDKEQEVLVIPFSYTLFDPDTMMIKFRNTHVADTAMLRSRRLHKIASSAIVILDKDVAIILTILLQVISNIVLRYDSWANRTDFVVDPKTKSSAYPGHIVVIVTEIRIWKVFPEPFDDVDSETSDDKNQIHYLN